jgi:hypothetical protein
MPIEFAPPQAQVQGFNIQPPQYTDPLQTLAEIGQLRNQTLQRQTAQAQLDLHRQKIESQQALLQAFVKGNGDPDETYKHAVQSGKVLPDDLVSFQQHKMNLAKDAAGLDELTRKNIATDIDRYRGLIASAKTQQDLDAANVTAKELGINPKIPRFTAFSDPEHLTAYSNGLATHSQILAEQEKQATIEREKAQTKEAGQKVLEGERQQVIKEIETAPIDPETGGPTPAAIAEIQKGHPNYKLPLGPWTAASTARFIRTGVAVEKQPEFDIKRRQLELGLLGNEKWDQFLMQYARGLRKAPGEPLSPEEFNQALSKYAELTQDPAIRALLVSNKGIQEQLGRAQLSSLPSDKELDQLGKDLFNLDIAPSQYAEFKTGRISYWPKVVERARQYAASQGQPFSLAGLDAKFKTWEDTEKKFATDQEAQMVRSFGNLMGHGGLLWDASEALGKKDLPLLQRIANTLGTAAGGDLQTTYDGIAKFVKDEASKAFLATGGSQGEREEKALSYSSNLGYKQRSGNIKTLMHLADEQRKGLEYQYEQGTSGKGQQKGHLFRPEALAERDRVLGRQQQAGGTLPLITTKEQYDKLPSGTLYKEQNGNTYRKP